MIIRNGKGKKYNVFIFGCEKKCYIIKYKDYILKFFG